MGVPTYLPIANITLGSAAASVTFSGITQQYRDLVLVVSTIQATANNQNPRMQFNSDSTASYNLVYMDGYGASTASGVDTANSSVSLLYSAPANSNANMATAHFMDYSAVDKHKTILVKYASPVGGVGAYGIRWASNSAINKIYIDANSQNFQSGSTFALYGVLA